MNLIKKYLLLFFKKLGYVIYASPKSYMLRDLSIYGNHPELLKISPNTYFGGRVTLFVNDTIEIGEYTMISINTIIHTSTHDSKDHPMYLKRIDRPVKIGNHIWIGIGVIILPGVIIEDYAIVGAGSIVNKNIPKGAVVAGNPIKIIRYREESEYANLPIITNPSDSKIVKGGYLNTYI
jgi:maltose O-acetyltransferase